jgi:ankyrin repeat protein
VNAQGGEYGNALQAAAYMGSQEIARLLLDRGADVSAQGWMFWNALQAATAEGNQEIVQLLLDRDTDVNAQGGGYGNALQAAAAAPAYMGNQETVRLLRLAIRFYDGWKKTNTVNTPDAMVARGGRDSEGVDMRSQSQNQRPGQWRRLDGRGDRFGWVFDDELEG